jgi:hypothetical protein
MKSNQQDKFSYTSLIIGSFRKHYDDMTNVIRLFHDEGIEVLSPKEAEILNPNDEFVVFDYDPKHLSEKELEDLVLEKMHKCHFVYLVNPGGYIGLSASFEVGYCAAHGIDVYALEPSTELCAKYIKNFLRPEEMADLAQQIYDTNNS